MKTHIFNGLNHWYFFEMNVRERCRVAVGGLGIVPNSAYTSRVHGILYPGGEKTARWSLILWCRIGLYQARAQLQFHGKDCLTWRREPGPTPTHFDLFALLIMVPISVPITGYIINSVSRVKFLKFYFIKTSLFNSSPFKIILWLF